MSIARRTGIFRSLGLLACIPAVTGCGLFAPEKAPPEPPPVEEYMPRTSPANVLDNLQLSHKQRHIDRYREQMNDEYRFIPNPNDDEVDYESLDFNEDQETTRKMFEDVDRIEMTLTYPDVAEPSDHGEYPASEGYRQILVSSVRMDVHTRQIIDSEPLIYQVAGDPATFIFKPDTTQSPVTWTIVYQKDDS